MRQRRHSLQVNTFPFLAVLLCAMGSLILLLLVIDRRARVVARAKALKAAEQAAAESDKAAEARHAEFEKRRRLLHQQLANEEESVAAQTRSLREQLKSTADRLAAEQEKAHGLLATIERRRSEIRNRDAGLAVRRKSLEPTGEQARNSETELAHFTAELEQMERTLAELKELRSRQRQLYSLVPYQGKRGDNRKPIYIECAVGGIILHPDRLTFDGSRFSPLELRGEIEKRASRSPVVTAPANGQPEDRVYILFLVRPEGITTYYKALASLQGLKVDFGYEFIDRDWILDFSEDKQPWTPAPPPAALPHLSIASKLNAGAKRASSPRPGGLLEMGSHSGQAGTASVMASPSGQNVHEIAGPTQLPTTLGSRRLGQAEPRGGQTWNQRGEAPSGPSGTISRPESSVTSVAGSRSGGPSQTPLGLDPGQANGGGSGNSGSQFPSGAGLSQAARRPGAPGALGDGAPVPPVEGDAQGGQTIAGLPSPMLPAGDLFRTSTQQQSAVASGNATLGLPQSIPSASAAPQTPNLAGSARQTSSGSQTAITPADGARQVDAAAVPGNNAGGRASDGATESAGLMRDPLGALMPQDLKKKKPRPLPFTGLLTGNRDWIISVECKTDAIILFPSRQRLTTAQFLGDQNGSNPLRQAVEEMIARRQATVRNGELPYRPMIRFRVWPDGVRTYYLAYPILEALGVPMAKENVETDQ